MDSIITRIRHSWNAFFNKDPTSALQRGYSSSYRPDRPFFSRGDGKSIVASIYNRIALDVASITIEHVVVNENKEYQHTVNDDLTKLFALEANKDQNSRAFIQDIVMSMFDEGVVALVPIDTSSSIQSDSFDIYSMRTGRITQWFPDYVSVNVYNDLSGMREDITLPKKSVAIIENPFYSVMNSPNSTLKRLLRKLYLLDAIDEQSGSGKLDLLIQLPYVIKSPARKAQAEERRLMIEQQLAGSKYGIAYIDGTEHVTQLNRPAENNLLSQVQYLTDKLYGELGMCKEIFDGTADEATMVKYYSRTLEPILAAIALEIQRKYLTEDERESGHTIKYFRDPFVLVPAEQLSEMVDKFSRNEIMSPNEFRSVLGRKPSSDPKANMLLNRNLNHKEMEPQSQEKKTENQEEIQNG